jgi:hypothetical protein
MARKPSEYGFWRAVQSLGLRQLFLCWDFVTALLLASVGVYFYTRFIPSAAAHVAIAGDFVVLTGALFGVVIAGLAIVAAVLDDKYARFIRRSEGSAYNLLRHFVVDGGLLIMAITAGIVYRSIASRVHHASATAEFALFGVCAFLFFWALFGAFQILKLVFAIADVGTSVVTAVEQPDTEEQAS